MENNALNVAGLNVPTLVMYQAILIWIFTVLRNLVLPDFRGVKERVLNFPPLYSIPLEISQPLFILLNLYKSACVSYYMGNLMNALLLMAAGILLLLEMPVKGDIFLLYFICMAWLTIAGIALGNRYINFLSLSILVSLSQPISAVVDISFYTCLARQYYELSPSTRHNEVRAVVCFVLGFTNSVLLYNYLSIYGPTPAMWGIEAMFAILTLGYVFAFADGTLMLRLHIAFAVYFQSIMIIFQFPIFEDNNFTYSLRLFK